MLFITNQGGSSVTKCTINSSDGSLFNCLVITNFGPHMDLQPMGYNLFQWLSLHIKFLYQVQQHMNYVLRFDSNSGNTFLVD